MADKSNPRLRRSKKNDLALPLHLQRLEAALDIRPMMGYMNKVLSKGRSSDSDSGSDSHLTEEEMCQGDKIIHGVVTTKEERRSDKLRLYNFEGASNDEERAWLRSALLSDSATDSSDDDGEITDSYLQRMLREHVVRKKYSAKYYKNPQNIRYMYYGAGLLSSFDKWPSLQRGTVPTIKAPPRPPQPPKRRKGRGGGGSGAPPAPPSSRKASKSSGHQAKASQQEPEDWDDIIPASKAEIADNEKLYAGMNPRAAARARKKAAQAKKPEVLAARRRKLWQLMGKKELGKVQRTRAAAHKDTLQNCKRMAALCTKHHRQKAMQSQKNMKETIWRCKRLTREMQSYWKRYDRVERETRRRMEKEAEEQRKMDVELIEAKRQQRKLNFLITQTELYAHFMSRKIGRDVSPSSQLRILSQLDEDKTPKNLSHLDTYDAEEMKERAARNAKEAFEADTARARQFLGGSGTGVGEHTQPALFRGTLKGYQLKGMNWLANLYDQGISGILADEMGLGKTVQCIAFLCHVAERLGVWGPFLVVSPASTLHNWQQEMQRFVPDFKVVPYWGNPNERKILRQFWERKDLHTKDAAFHVVITSYQIVVADFKYMNRIKWQHMILDEAQAIKSSGSQRWKLLLGFSCRNRLLLSGTPIQNSMAELWALLHFIMPTLFDSHEEFNEWFSKDIESHAENKTTIDEKHLSRLHMILKPFMLRRIKKDVENELSDKIEVMVYCPLTTRQHLLYYALKKKIKIDDLLHYSVGGDSGHSVDKNFTSNLMNLVMQFRKVCNHPELFERRDVRSPFFMKCEDINIPKLFVEDMGATYPLLSKIHLLYNKFSIFAKEYVHRSLFNSDNTSSTFSFTRFINMSPEDMYTITLGDWYYLVILMLILDEQLKRIRHRKEWWERNECNCDSKEFIRNVNISNRYSYNSSSNRSTRCCEASMDVSNSYYEGVLSKHRLVICPNGRTLRFEKKDSYVWQGLLFTDTLLSGEPMIFSHEDHHIYYMAETMEHRLIRSKHPQTTAIPPTSPVIKSEPIEGVLPSSPKKTPSKIVEMRSPHKKPPEDPAPPTCSLHLLPEFPHRNRAPILRPCEPTPLPGFLYSPTVKINCGTRHMYACSRASAHRWIRRERVVQRTALLTPTVKTPPTASVLSVPDKQTLITDAGKLNVLDSLLKRLKAQGHRVLIYSQMTKMIDLLEEYMWHRKHKYMRLDGSSKISARRDMVADFQARSDIFVFLLSTRAGGLGINLTAADTVIFYDSDWNPTVDQQAMDRAHRLGQTKQVTVYRLICKGTIEERIMQRAREKSEIQRMVISGGNFKPDTLKPKEVVSLLLDDEEIEMRYRQRAEERRMFDENRLDVRVDKDRKRKLYGLSPKGGDSKRGRGSEIESGPSSPGDPLQSYNQQDDTSSEAFVLDIDSPNGASTPVSFPSPYGASGMRPRRPPGRGARRGRPRGSRRLGPGRPPPAAPATPAPSDPNVSLAAPSGIVPSAPRPRRGPGRPRLRAGGGPAPGGRGGGGRARRHHRGPLLVPLGGGNTHSSEA